MEMNEEQVERFVVAIESIADVLEGWYKLDQQRFEKEFPVKRNPLDVRDATITRPPTPEEELKKSQGASDEPIEEWVGLREQELLDKGSQESSTVTRASTKRVSAKKAGRK